MDEAARGRPRRQAGSETPTAGDPPAPHGGAVQSPDVARETARLEALESEVAKLSAAVAGLGARLTALESEAAAPTRPAVRASESSPEEALAEPDLDSLVPDARAVSGVLTDVGRCILIVAGGFLVRAITDAGVIPRPAGVAAGLAYAVAWLVLADRAAARGRRRTASFLSITAVILGYPLLIETTTRMHAFSPIGASVAAASLTALVLLVASRRDLLAAGWLAVLAEAVTAVVLGFATGRPEPFAAACVVIAGATAWLGDTWEGAASLRWPAALVADALVLWAVLGLESRQAASPSQLLSDFALAAVLAIGPLAWVSRRTLAPGRPPGVFEMFQVTVSLAIGFVAAVEAVRIVPASRIWLGAAFFATSAACLSLARWAHGRALPPRIALLYATWATALLLCGGWSLQDAGARALVWSLSGVAAAAAGRRPGLGSLRIHATLLLLAAALPGGLLSASLRALFSAADAPGGSVSPWAWVVLAAVAAAYLLIGPSSEETAIVASAAALVLGAIGAFSLAALAIAGLRALWPGDAGMLAALRTAVLSGAALSLAWARRRSQRPELSWLAAAFLVAGAVKLLFEDLPNGRSLTLFAGFVLYGGALLGVQRLLRSRAAPAV
jgi:hypothetical protein